MATKDDFIQRACSSNSRFQEATETNYDGVKMIPQKTWLFVGNLTVGTTKENFVEIFSKYGKLVKVFVMSDKGFAFVQMDSRANAERAKYDLDQKVIHGQIIRVKYVTRGAAISIKNLSPVVTNEWLEYGFSQFGKVERAVVIVDNKGQSTTRGIVEFHSEESAQNAVQQIKEGCFLMTSSPRVISATLIEQEDSEDGLPEDNVIKSSLYYLETKALPRFAESDSFEEYCARKWKARDDLELQRREKLERSISESREIFKAQLEIQILEHQTLLMKQDLLNRQVKHEQSDKKGKTTLERGQFQITQVNAHKNNIEVSEFELKQETLPDQIEGEVNSCKVMSESDLTSSSPNGRAFEIDASGCRKLEEKQYQCPQCPRRYKYKVGLAAHVRIHDEETQIKCEICPMIFPTKQNYNRHMRTHTGEKPFKCSTCDRAFRSLSHLKSHQYTHVSAKTFKCTEHACGKFFRSPAQLHNHQTKHLKKRFECFECKKKFHQNTNLKAHERIHLNIRPYECNICEKRFTQSAHLKRHMRIHAD